MACGGLKYNGIIFGNKKELLDYVLNGVKPETNVSIQEVKNDIIKDAVKSSNTNTAVDAIINISDITEQQRSVLKESFGLDTAQAYVDYIETGNISAPNKNAIRTIFQDVSTMIKDMVSSIEYSNSQPGSKTIEISPNIIELTNKIKINDSQRFIPSKSGSESAGTSGVLQLEKEKWFNPREEGAQGTAGEVQAVQGGQEENISGQTRGGVSNAQRTGVANSEDSTDSEINTARDSGINTDGNPRRIQLATGEYVSWDADRREWTNIVRNVSGDRWGTVRAASQRERAAAAAARESRIITTESSNDTAINMIFGQGDPISNLSALKGMGYINLNPSELYNKLKTQFDNNGIGIDQIASVIGTELYPSLFSIVGENAINNMDNKIVLENLNVAKEMETSGLDPLRIKIATGWERGEFDKKWRYELDPVVSIDNQLINQIIDREGTETFNYNELFSGLETAYPNINKLKIIFDDTEDFRTKEGIRQGYYSISKRSITINKRAARLFENPRYTQNANGADKGFGKYSSLGKTVNHEIQHFIQEQEGFLQGSSVSDIKRLQQIVFRYPIILELTENPNITNSYLSSKYYINEEQIELFRSEVGRHDMDELQASYNSVVNKRTLYDIKDPLNAYEAVAGEVEARNAEERISMPIDERRTTLLTSTEDFPRNEQVIINKNEYRQNTSRRTDRRENFSENRKGTNLQNSDSFNRRNAIDDGRNSINASNGADQRYGYKYYPSNLDNPKQFFSNIGFAPAQTELLSFIHGLIPDAYNKTNTAIKIAMELMYPDQTGFNIMNEMPYTKEEMYDMITRYQNENISDKLGSIFIHEYVNNEISFGMERNKELLEGIINKAKSLQIELPQQYENYFEANNKFKTFFKKGQKLRNREDVLYVYDINYSDPENITYVLWHPEEDAYYEMDMLKMDLFREDTESISEQLEDTAIDVINSLSELGTMVRFMPKQKTPGIFNVFNNEIHLDVRKLTNKLIYHEAAHAVFVKGIRLNKENLLKIHKDIYNVLINGTPQERSLAAKIDFFLQSYNEAEAEMGNMPLDELRANEFLAELVAQLADNKMNISPQSQKSIIDKIIEFFRNVLGYNKNIDINNIDDVIEMINGIANKLRTGEVINFSDYENLMSDKNINQGELYARGDLYTGDVKKVITPGKKYIVNMPDGKDAKVIVTLSGTNNNGDGFVEFQFSDGTTERYLTHHLILTEVFDDMYSIKLMPAASQKANPTHQGNVMSNADKQMLKEFALEQKADGTYEYSISEIHYLIKDDVQVDYNVFVDLINGFREAQALAAAKSTDPISDEVYQDFVENNSVSQDLLESIADKVATRKKLSKREAEIYAGRTAEIDKIIADYATSKTPTTPVAPAPSSINDKKLQKILFDLNTMTVTPEVAEILKTGVAPGRLINFDSGDTIEAKTGSIPENSQLAVVFETRKAIEKGREHLAALKDYYGDDAFNKIIDLLATGQAGMVGTSVMYVTLSQDLASILEADPSYRPLVRAMRKKLNRFMQAYARNASIIMNLQRVANINPETLFASTNIANSIVIKGDTKEAKDSLLEALQQEELDEAYLEYSSRREAAAAAASGKQYTKPTTTKTSQRKKSKPSDWTPRGNGFLDSAIRAVKDYINKNC